MNTLLFSGLMLGLLGANPSGTYGGVSSPTYECGTTCGNSYDSCDSCDTCAEPCGRPCGRGTCSDRTACGPLSFVFSIFNCNTWRGPSCGERYWGDFYSDPPECNDPCDPCGNYTGRSNYGGSWSNVRGYSSAPTGGGCSSCNKNRVFSDEPIAEQGRVSHPSVRVSRQPTPVKAQIKAVRPQ